MSKGRPSRHIETDVWLKVALAQGAILRESLVEAAKNEKPPISTTTLVRAKERLNIATLHINGIDKELWIDMKLVPVADTNLDAGSTVQEAVASEDELIAIARRYRKHREPAEECFAAMIEFAKEHPADPPIPHDRVVQLFRKYGPRAKTPDEIADDTEIARLTKLSEVDFQVWQKDYIKSRSRLQTREEFEAARANALKILNETIAQIGMDLLSSQTVPLSADEIDQLPEIASFKAKYLSQDSPDGVLARKEKGLFELREKYVGSTRPMTPEEVAAEKQKANEKIARLQEEFEQEQKRGPRFVRALTQKELNFLDRARTAHYR